MKALLHCHLASSIAVFRVIIILDHLYVALFKKHIYISVYFWKLPWLQSSKIFTWSIWFFFFFISRVRHLVVWTLWVWLFDGFQYCRIFLFCWLSFFYFLFLELLLYVGLVLLITFCTIFHFFLFVLSRQGWQVYLSTLVSKFLFFSFKHSFALCSYFYSILFLFHWL